MSFRSGPVYSSISSVQNLLDSVEDLMWVAQINPVTVYGMGRDYLELVGTLKVESDDPTTVHEAAAKIADQVRARIESVEGVLIEESHLEVVGRRRHVMTGDVRTWVMYEASFRAHIEGLAFR